MQNTKSNVISIDQAKQVKFIRAGAGAGKTTNLISNCIEYIIKFHNKHQRYPKIIITTFTTKATQEIKERLLLKSLEYDDTNLFQHISQKNGVHVGTIHSVLSLLLRQTSENIGLSNNFQIKDDGYFYQHCKKILKKKLQESVDYLELLNHYSYSDLTHIIYKFSNKKMEFLNLQPVPQEQLRDRAHEFNHQYISVIERYLNFANHYPSAWEASTIFLRQLKVALENQNLQEIESCYALYKPVKKFTFKKDVGLSEEDNELISDLFKPDFITGVSFDESLNQFNRLNNLFYKLALLISEALFELKKEQSSISISDLELLAKKILNEYPQEYNRFSQQYDYIMIDEYQDTSPIQVELLNALVEHKSHFIVGDPQQSIYLFRGARSEVFNIKENEFKQKNLPIEILDTNYRSSARLMSFINSFFSLYSNQFSPMKLKNTDFETSPFYEAYFVTADDVYSGLLFQVQNLINSGAQYSDITILFKKNDQILDFSRYASKFGLPVQIQIAKGFDSKSEILDLISILKFVVNPYDNENLIQVLRMPWFTMTDQQILDLCQNQNLSIWSQLKAVNNDDYTILKKIEETYLRNGLSHSLSVFLTETIFLRSALYFDSSTRRESNIWKFVQTVAEKEKNENFNICDFINKNFSSLNQDLTSSTGEAIPLTAANRVSLMTVHGSKGLQFKHVIIVGLEDQVKSQSPDIFCINENDQKFCLKMFSSESSDKLEATHWAHMVADAYTDKLLQENDRLLYVAVTRAQSTVSFIRKNKKSVKNSWIEKINWSIDQYTQENFSISFVNTSETYFEFKNHDLGKKEMILSLKSENIVEKKHQAITEMIKSTGVNVHHKSNDVSFKNDYVRTTLKAQKGTELHRFFEALKYQSAHELINYLDEGDRRALVWLQEQEQIPLMTILENGYVEMGFGVTLKVSIDNDLFQNVQGQIDAWGIYHDDVYIIDYKTGSDQYLDKALKQLNFYAVCLMKMNFIKSYQKVHLAVIYPYDQNIIIKTINSQNLEKELFI